MTDGPADATPEPAGGVTDRRLTLQRAARPLILTLLAASALRIGFAVAAGIVDVTENAHGAPPSFATGERVAAFGEAGDGTGALLVLIAVILLWVQLRWLLTAPDARSLRRWRATGVAAGWLSALTAVSSIVFIVGTTWEFGHGPFALWAQVVGIDGFSLAYVVVAGGALYVVRGLLYQADAVAYSDADRIAAAVFAVDRKTGDVLAWSTMREAVEQAPVYGVEDDEYEFFLDDGTVLTAAIVDDRVTLTPTETERFDDLVAALQEYARRRDLRVDTEDTAEPLAYVDPISRGRWLEMWPAWMRPIGRLIRPPR